MTNFRSLIIVVVVLLSLFVFILYSGFSIYATFLQIKFADTRHILFGLALVLKTVIFLIICLGPSLIYILIASLILMALFYETVLRLKR